MKIVIIVEADSVEDIEPCLFQAKQEGHIKDYRFPDHETYNYGQRVYGTGDAGK